MALMYSTAPPHELKTSRDLRRSAPSRGVSTGTLPAINKKALLNDTFQVPLKKKTSLTPLSNAPKTPKFNNFLAAAEQTAPLSLTFGALELAITGGSHDEDVESMNISHFVKTPEHKRCVQMLTEGFVESFVDFFYLTHKKDPSSTEATVEQPETEDPREEFSETSISLHDMPNEVLDFLMERLSEAEDAQREGDATGVVRAYRELAAHFEKNHEFTTAVHFHQKGLDASFRLGDSTHAADSYRCIGVDYEALGNIPLAIQYFDKYSDLAQKSPNNKEAIATSFKHLVKAYRTFAEQLEEKAAIDGSQETLRSAVEYYIKCLAMAKNISDSTAEGTVNYRLGLVYKQLGKPELSIKHLQNYMYLCRINGDSEGESAACSALADSYISSSDIHQSVKYLEDNIALAQRTNQPISQAHACRDLGVIYDQQEDYEKALEYFEKYYKLALEAKDRSLVDNARVYLGIARGNIKLMRMFNIPNHSITPATMKPIPPSVPNTNSGMPSARRNANALRSSADALPYANERVKERKDGMRSPSGTPRTHESVHDAHSSPKRSRTPRSARGAESGRVDIRPNSVEKRHAVHPSDNDEQSPSPLNSARRESPRSARSHRSMHADDVSPRRVRPPTSPLSARDHVEGEEEPRLSTPPLSARVATHHEGEAEEPEEKEEEADGETTHSLQQNEGTPRRSPSSHSVKNTPRSARGVSHDSVDSDTKTRTPRSARGAADADGIVERTTPRTARGGVVDTKGGSGATPRSARGADGAVTGTPRSSRGTVEGSGTTPRSARVVGVEDTHVDGKNREETQQDDKPWWQTSAEPTKDEGLAGMDSGHTSEIDTTNEGENAGNGESTKPSPKGEEAGGAGEAGGEGDDIAGEEDGEAEDEGEISE